MLRDRDRNLRIEEITVGRGSPAIGQPLSTLHINAIPGLLLLALIEGKEGRYHFKPKDDLVIGEGETLIVMGDPAAVGQLRERYGGQTYAALATTVERPAAARP
jgi:uncharacterized protein with PhoU and TrkA domain